MVRLALLMYIFIALFPAYIDIPDYVKDIPPKRRQT